MPLSNVTIDRVDGKTIVRFGIHAADLAAMKRTHDLLTLLDDYYSYQDAANDLVGLIASFEAGDKRRVAIEEGVLGPVTKTKPE